MKRLTVRMIPFDDIRCHARFVFIEDGKADEVIDERITPELCVKLYRGKYCDEYGTQQYTIEQTALEYMVDTFQCTYH